MNKRLIYVAGPGDVVGTYRYWKSGQQDPRVPTITYSSMFYDLVAELDAEALILHANPSGEELDDGQFHFRSEPRRATGGRLRYFLAQAGTARRISGVINAFSPDAAIVSSDAPALALRLVNRKTKLFLSMHNTFWPMQQPPSGVKGRLKDAVRPFFYHRVDGAVCTSDECARQFRKVRGNGVPILVERPAMSFGIAPKAPSDGLTRMVYVGRIEQSKGVFLLMDAFENLAGRFPELSLVYVGDGSARTALTRRAEASPYVDRIDVCGRLPARGVSEALLSADILVCPTMTSFNEGLALVCLEAASVGVPVVLSSVVPARDLLGKACAVFEANSGPGLESVLSHLISDPQAYFRLAESTHDVARMLRDPSETWKAQLRRLLADTF